MFNNHFSPKGDEKKKRTCVFTRVVCLLLILPMVFTVLAGCSEEKKRRTFRDPDPTYESFEDETEDTLKPEMPASLEDTDYTRDDYYGVCYWTDEKTGYTMFYSLDTYDVFYYDDDGYCYYYDWDLTTFVPWSDTDYDSVDTNDSDSTSSGNKYCSRCKNTGYHTCSFCDGKGYREVIKNAGSYDGSYIKKENCNVCDNTGSARCLSCITWNNPD